MSSAQLKLTKSNYVMSPPAAEYLLSAGAEPSNVLRALVDVLSENADMLKYTSFEILSGLLAEQTGFKRHDFGGEVEDVDYIYDLNTHSLVMAVNKRMRHKDCPTRWSTVFMFNLELGKPFSHYDFRFLDNVGRYVTFDKDGSTFYNTLHEAIQAVGERYPISQVTRDFELKRVD